MVDTQSNSVFVPAALLAMALAVSLATMTVEAALERRQLNTALESLDAQEQAAKKLRAALDTLATASSQLAARGNPNAQEVIESLKKRGVSISPKNSSK